MNITEFIMKYKYYILAAILLLIFGTKSTCNGVTKFGFCTTQNGEVTHYSPLNYFNDL